MVSKLPFVLYGVAVLTTGLTFAQSTNVRLDKSPLTKRVETTPSANQPALSPEERGDLLMVRKRFREAIDSYEQAVERSAVLYNKIGIAFHQMMQLDTAKKYYEKAIKLNPQYAEAINNVGTVYYAKRSYRRAVKYYKKALKLAPQSASIYSNLGTAYFARRKYKDAAQAYQIALSLDPDIFEHRGTSGSMLQERSVAEKAKFHFYLAKAYAKAGMTERALLYIRKALEEGFKDRDKLREDPEFAGMQKLPEFQALLKLEPRVL